MLRIDHMYEVIQIEEWLELINFWLQLSEKILITLYITTAEGVRYFCKSHDLKLSFFYI